MIPDNNAILLFRFGEQRWIDKIIEGELSFSCAGAFINQAKRSGNNIQGDKYEAVFARLRVDDKKIIEMRAKFGRDLEEIEDGEFVLLRRKSAKFKPIFCFYSYKAIDALRDGNIQKVGENTIRHEFDEKMYSGFADYTVARNVVADSHRFTQITLQPKPFVDRIKVAMAFNGYNYIMQPVDYQLLKNETFFIEPTDDYKELFYKNPDYAYQYECRIYLKDKKLKNIFERFPLHIGQLRNDEYKKTYEPMYMNLNVIIGNRK